MKTVGKVPSRMTMLEGIWIGRKIPPFLTKERGFFTSVQGINVLILQKINTRGE
jgi:hypothetical protein